MGKNETKGYSIKHKEKKNNNNNRLYASNCDTNTSVLFRFHIRCNFRALKLETSVFFFFIIFDKLIREYQLT